MAKPPIEFRRKPLAVSVPLVPGVAGYRGLTVADQLAHKKALKAAQMRRYRAKKAGK